MKASTSTSASSINAASLGTFGRNWSATFGVVLNKGGADEGGDDTTALAAGIGKHVAHEVNPAAS